MYIVQGAYDQTICYCSSEMKGDFFEFSLTYTGRNEVFRELDRFVWESKHCLRFQNEYSGNVVVDVSEWNSKSEYEFNEYFDAFMYYLHGKQDKLNVTFIVSGECSASLYKSLTTHFDLKVVEPEVGEVAVATHKVKIGFGSRGE